MKINMFLWLAVILLFHHRPNAANAAKIIDSTPQVVSHVLEHVGLLEELVQAGHQVYICLESKFPQRHRLSFVEKGLNILTYHMPDDEPTFADPAYESDVAKIIFERETNFLDEVEVPRRVMRDCTYMMRDKKFLEEASRLRFDLAIVEPFFLESCNLILPHYLGVPFVSLTNQYMPWSVRSPSPPSVYPRHFFDFDVTTMPTFRTRFSTLFFTLMLHFNYPISFRRNNTLLEEFKVPVDSWDELLLRSSLFLYEVDHHLGSPIPAYPNHISVAGLTCKPAKSLDDKHERLMSNNPNGVILMSFGSMGSFMPRHLVEKFFDAFARLNQSVIARLKISPDVLVPANVEILEWLPQNDIMAHPNLRLFITHCGNNGQHEGLYHGVPMLGVPLFAEQKQNCRRGVVKGFGLMMSVYDFTADHLHADILRLLNDHSFSESVKRASKIFRSQPMTPQRKAVFWIEHVIEFGGQHLRPTAMDLPLYQLFLLDVLGVCLAAIFVVFLFVFCALRCAFGRLCGKRDAKVKKS